MREQPTKQLLENGTYFLSAQTKSPATLAHDWSVFESRELIG